jgi:GH18 family chitinase
VVSAHRSAFAVVGYLPEWRYGGANFDTLFDTLTHLVFFSAEPSASGALVGLDRLPDAETLAAAKRAAARTGTKLLLCLGGNGRSSFFSAATATPAARGRLVAAVVAQLDAMGLDGVDYNWEYPGYAFGRGYDEAAVEAEWDALAALVRDTKAAGVGVVSLAYYPDGRQERLLAARRLDTAADLLHAMAYDKPGAQHSPMSLAHNVVNQARAAGLRTGAVTLGLPMYGRNAHSGEWTTWEDLVQQTALQSADSVTASDGAVVGFNGPDTLRKKVRLALRSGLGGVMVWESGQDCRVAPVTRGGRKRATRSAGGATTRHAARRPSASKTTARRYGQSRSTCATRGVDSEAAEDTERSSHHGGATRPARCMVRVCRAGGDARSGKRRKY